VGEEEGDSIWAGPVRGVTRRGGRGGGGDDASRVSSVGRREAGARGGRGWGACVISSPILFLSLVGGRGERGLLDARGRRCLPSIPPSRLLRHASVSVLR
jgi:hypothetical protein